MILKIALAVAAVLLVSIATVLGIAASRPNTMRIQRAISIDAPPQRIEALIGDFHNWGQWAPQDREDRTMTRSYSGPKSGKGAVSHWQSRGSAGQGRMEIVEFSPYEIAVKVDFEKPFAAHNLNRFTLEARDGYTYVTWTMQGTVPFVAKVMGVFVDMDAMMGKHFETGLESLKAAAEAPATGAA